MEENNVNWVDSRAGETFDRYKECVIERYGEDKNLHPELDKDLWIESSGGKKKGRLYGAGQNSDPYDVLTGTSSIPSTRISQPSRESDEVRQLKEEVEQGKAERETMMEKFEEQTRLFAEMSEKIRLLSQNLPPNFPSS